MFRFPAKVADLSFAGASRQILEPIQHPFYSIIIVLQGSEYNENTLTFIEFRVYEYVANMWSCTSTHPTHLWRDVSYSTKET